MKTKERNNILVQRAFELMNDKRSKYRQGIVDNNGFVDKAYASQISAFSVSVAMIGLKPTLAMYYDKGGSAVNTHNIVGLIAELLTKDGYADFSGKAESFFKHAMSEEDDDTLRMKVIDNAVALKVVIRTFLKSE